MKRIRLLCFCAMATNLCFAQIDARLFRYPDVSQTQIAFVYGGDVWMVPKTGGTANRITSSTGEESYPRFSPDGKILAFSATYDGNTDVYTMPVTGGVPLRLTWHAAPDRVVDWHPDGKRILFASGRESGTPAYRQFYLVSNKGGMAEKLPLKSCPCRMASWPLSLPMEKVLPMSPRSPRTIPLNASAAGWLLMFISST
jgi:tricorn protease